MLSPEISSSLMGINRANEDTVGKLLQELAHRGFLEEQKENSPENYSIGWRFPRFPPIRTLSFGMGRATSDRDLSRIKALILEAIERFGMVSFGFLVHDEFQLFPELERLVLDVLQDSEYVICEFWSTDPNVADWLGASQIKLAHGDRALVSVGCDPNDGEAGISAEGQRSIWGWDSSITPSALACRADLYHLLANYAESYGCLHFDEEWRVFPDVSEQHYSIGQVGEGFEIESVLADDRLKTYWGFNKDRRAKCQDCEFRYACPNPLSKRLIETGLGSAPSNCNYDLEVGKW